MSAAPVIERFLPHRAPFRFVDEVVRVAGHKGEFCLHLPCEDPRLHNGRLAPLLLIEALAQCAAAFFGVLLDKRGDQDGEGRIESGYLVQIDHAELSAAACAGEDVSLCIERTRQFGSLVQFAGTARAGQRLLVTSRFTVARTEAAA